MCRCRGRRSGAAAVRLFLAHGTRARGLELQIKLAVKPLFKVVKSNMREYTFQQRSPKPQPVRRSDTWSSAFLPSKVQSRIILSHNRPGNMHLAIGARKRPVLGGVGHELMQGERKVLCILRADTDWTALHRHVRS